MTTQTRIQLKLQRDSGSIFYQDMDDNLSFHIEACKATSTSPSAAEGALSNKASEASASDSEHRAGGTASSDWEESTATTDLIKSFLRQHLLKNGESSRYIVPLMKRDGVEALLIATVALHLRKDSHVHTGEVGGLRDDGAAIRSLHKTLGSLVSTLQQREGVLRYLEENPHFICEEADEEGI